MSARFEPVIGRYMHIDLFGRSHRLYVEEAGQGTPLLCLHTAGADGRQYRGLMNDERVTAGHRVIAFDMPWHGKSSPPAGWQNEEYQLTSAQYTEMILAVSDALELDKPIVMGCSIGGRIVLHLALDHPERFRAIIGLQAGGACQSLLRPELPAPSGRAWWRGLCRHRLWPGRPGCAGPRSLGNAMALHAGRTGRVQGRPLLLQARR
jgi:pimeloyl-ACP methyl ester carboxylesterase